MTRVGYRQSDFPGLGVVLFQCHCLNETDNRTSKQDGRVGMRAWDMQGSL